MPQSFSSQNIVVTLYSRHCLGQELTGIMARVSIHTYRFLWDVINFPRQNLIVWVNTFEVSAYINYCIDFLLGDYLSMP